MLGNKVFMEKFLYALVSQCSNTFGYSKCLYYLHGVVLNYGINVVRLRVFLEK